MVAGAGGEVQRVVGDEVGKLGGSLCPGTEFGFYSACAESPFLGLGQEIKYLQIIFILVRTYEELLGL